MGANSLKIAVTKSDGTTECYVEVEKWDLGNEKAWLWAKIPSINNMADTEIYLYYDNDHADNTDKVGPPNSVPAENVWDTNFKLVSHMRDDPDNTTIRDSTDNDNDGAKLGAGEPAVIVDGEIDDAQDFDGNDDFISLGDSPDFEFGNSADDSPFSVEAWIRMVDATNFRIIGKYENPEEWVFHTAGSDKLYFYMQDESAQKYIGRLYNTALTAQQGNWIHVFGTYSGNEASSGIKIYLNGVRVDDATFEDLPYTAMEPGTSPVYIGRTLAIYADGDIDEIRISNAERNIAWVKATYETGQDDLLDYGSEEFPPLEAPNKLFGAGFNDSAPYVILRWTSNLTDISFFEIQNSTDKISWDYLGQSTTNQYTDLQVTNGLERFYRIRACNFTGGAWYNSTFTDINFEKVYFVRGGDGLFPGLAIGISLLIIGAAYLVEKRR